MKNAYLILNLSVWLSDCRCCRSNNRSSVWSRMTACSSAAWSQTDHIALWMYHSSTHYPWSAHFHSLWLSVAPPTSLLLSLFLDYLWDSWVKIYLQDINGDFWLLHKWATRCSRMNATWSAPDSNKNKSTRPAAALQQLKYKNIGFAVVLFVFLTCFIPVVK